MMDKEYTEILKELDEEFPGVAMIDKELPKVGTREAVEKTIEWWFDENGWQDFGCNFPVPPIVTIIMLIFLVLAFFL